MIFFTHRVRLRELLELDRKTYYDFRILLIFETTNFYLFDLDFTFKITTFLFDSIMSKERNKDLMKKHGFYYVFIMFWFFDNLFVF